MSGGKGSLVVLGMLSTPFWEFPVDVYILSDIGVGIYFLLPFGSFMEAEGASLDSPRKLTPFYSLLGVS